MAKSKPLKLSQKFQVDFVLMPGSLWKSSDWNLKFAVSSFTVWSIKYVIPTVYTGWKRCITAFEQLSPSLQPWHRILKNRINKMICWKWQDSTLQGPQIAGEQFLILTNSEACLKPHPEILGYTSENMLTCTIQAPPLLHAIYSV